MNRVKIPVLALTINEHERDIEKENLGLKQESLEDAYWWLYCETQVSDIYVDPEEVMLIQDLTDGFCRLYVGNLTSFVSPISAEELNELL